MSPCRSREGDDPDRRGPPVGGRERKGRGRQARLRGRGKVGRREGEFGPGFGIGNGLRFGLRGKERKKERRGILGRGREKKRREGEGRDGPAGLKARGEKGMLFYF